MSRQITNYFLINFEGRLTMANIVMGNKDERVEIRIKAGIKNDLKVIAEMRGLTPSSVIHSLIVKAINEDKMQFPERFEEIKREQSALVSGELAPQSKNKMPLVTLDKKKKKDVA